MNSNRTLEINEVLCSCCNKVFYEFEGYEMSECPNCKEGLSDHNCRVTRLLDVPLEVDFKTGTVTVQSKKTRREQIDNSII